MSVADRSGGKGSRSRRARRRAHFVEPCFAGAAADRHLPKPVASH